VRTRRALWSTWRTVAPVGAWVSSVEQSDAEDYGAGAPWRAEKLPLKILIPAKGREFQEGCCGSAWQMRARVDDRGAIRSMP
jgi:hypothetical protein